MTDSKKKSSFADRFKGGGGFKGSANSGGSSFVKRFRSEKEKDNTSEDADNTSEDGENGGEFKGSANSYASGFIKRFRSEKKKSDKKGLKKRSINNMSHAEQVRRKRSRNVFLVRGKDRGRAAWHYVLVDNNKRELFLAATRSGSLDIADYGVIVHSGWGKDPPESVKKKIADEYNL